MEATWTRIEVTEAEAFARDTLFAPSRSRPIVALTTSVGERRPWIDPGQLAAELGEPVEVLIEARSRVPVR
jgi:hypothetical protein